MSYKVPFVGYPVQYRNLENEILPAVKEVLFKGDLILREQVRQFENNVASFSGATHAIGLNSGTDALYLSLRAAGIDPGDEVITVAHTYVATVAAIVHCGAIPILIDVDEDHNMNLEQIENAITPKTKAIMPVHLNGRLCNMEKLMAIAQKHNLLVVEDAAQAMGATFDGQKAGSFGLTGCFSFYPAKILGAYGDAGIVVTSNDELADKIRLLRDHGHQRSTDEFVLYGFNSRLDNLQAAILNVKFRHLPAWIERRREIAGLYQEGLSDISQIELPPAPQNSGKYFDVFQNYVIRSPERDKLVNHLRESGIEILISWPIPMHHQKALNLSHFHLPETESISREVLSLPLYPELDNKQVEHVIESIHQFYKNSNSRSY